MAQIGIHSPRAFRRYLTGALFSGCLGFGAFLPAAAAAEGHPAVTLSQSPAEIRSYWTPERMREATPVPIPSGHAAKGLGTEDERDAPAATGAAALDTNTQQLERAEYVPENTSYPARTHGKVFFTIPGDGNFTCSGTVVRSRSKNLVWTAGHCVYDDVSRRFATNWTFVPGYEDGERPFGEWPARRLATTGRWRKEGNFSYDVGAAKLVRHEGRRIQKVVGARGITFNQPRDQTFRAFGYPALPNLGTLQLFNGERLYACDSPYLGADNPPGKGPDALTIECDMTAGASGGGWIVDGRSVNSVVSYGYDHDFAHLYGPYFGSKVHRLYKRVRGHR